MKCLIAMAAGKQASRRASRWAGLAAGKQASGRASRWAGLAADKQASGRASRWAGPDFSLTAGNASSLR